MSMPRYFAYSPVDMTIEEALENAYQYLEPDQIVHVQSDGDVEIHWLTYGDRPRALPDTYLVRVEQDDSLRVVDRALS